MSDQPVVRLDSFHPLSNYDEEPTRVQSAEPEAPVHIPYPLLRFGNLKPNLSTDYLIKNLLDRGSMTVMYGQSGSSKSFCALEMSMAIASGLKWRGIRVRKGRVAYIAAEGGHGITNRLYAMQENIALGNIAEIEFYLVRSTVKLTEDSPDVDRFIQTIEAEVGDGGLDLVVIDTLSRSIAGRNENSPQDMSAAVEAADRLRTGLGCAVLIIHHSGKNEAQGARGHSSLKAALETELEVKQVGESYSLTVTKQREHESGTQWWHRLEPIEIGVDDEDEPVTTCLVRPIETESVANNGGEKPLNSNEQRTLSALRALLSVVDGTSLEAPEAILKANLRDWVETRAGVDRKMRRNVINKGLKGLKSRGIIETEGEKVFLTGKEVS